MKIVYIDPQSYNNLAQYDYSLLKNLQGEIIYCCSSLYDMSELQGVSYRKVFRYNKISNPLLKGLSYIWSILHISLLLAKIRPDVVHIQWWRLWYIDYVALYLYRLFARQVVYTAHNILPHDTGNRYRNKSIAYYKKVDKIIVHTERTRQELISEFKLPQGKIYVVRHGIIHPHCNEEKVRIIMRQLTAEYHLDKRIIFSALGLQSAYKGTELIKNALQSSQSLKNNSKVFVFIIGKGTIIKPNDFSTVSNVFVYNEFVEAEYMQAVMRLTDVLLLPYLKISQSGILLSAIQYHIPYIATDVGGLTEPFDYADVGWKLSKPSAVALRLMMEQLANNPNNVRSKRYDIRGWNRVEKLYDWTQIGVETMQCYKSKSI